MSYELDDLPRYGFKPVSINFKGERQEVLRRMVRVNQMPYAREHMVDNKYIFEDSTAVVDVSSSGLILLTIPDSDYTEGPAMLASDYGQALLGDVIAVPLT